jgi:hypothetical protein
MKRSTEWTKTHCAGGNQWKMLSFRLLMRWGKGGKMEKIQIFKRVRYLDATENGHTAAASAFRSAKYSKRRNLLIDTLLAGRNLKTDFAIAEFIMKHWEEIEEIIKTEYEMEVIGDGIPAKTTDENEIDPIFSGVVDKEG